MFQELYKHKGTHNPQKLVTYKAQNMLNSTLGFAALSL